MRDNPEFSTRVGNRRAVSVNGCLLLFFEAIAASTTAKIGERIAKLPRTEVWQDGEGERTVLFDVADFGKVAQIMRPKRRRQVSEDERQRLAEMSRRFSPLRISQGDLSSPSCVPTA
jgi:hypothetical protein